jgi:arylsulfatase A-like enzyme
MKCIMVMFDSLNRHMLSPFGCDWTHTPNFARLAERTATFETSYVGSMPCMPARRELHTGRYNFLHRSWGPMEPFDDSMPKLLRENNIHSHLATDHYHYWEEGGCNYHTKFSTWQGFRGQEGDPWMADLSGRVDMIPDSLNHGRSKTLIQQDMVNRHYQQNEALMPQAQTFAAGLEFFRTNATADDWFLQIETFDPHEPYFVPQRFLDLYEDTYTGPHWDWPPYRAVAEEDRPAVEHMRIVNAALHSMCDEYLGRVLDAMDELNLWNDTMLIVNTDHGFLLGEHDLWAKCHAPFYNEVAHTPLFIWDPRTSHTAGQRRTSLVQTIDLPATILEYFGLDCPADMQGQPLAQTIADDTPVRQAGLFGLFGGHVNVTDGRYVYMRAPATADNGPLFQYTHMPAHMRHVFSVEEMQTLETLAEPFACTKGCRTMKIPSRLRVKVDWDKTMLFDLQADPQQNQPIDDPAVEQQMIDHLTALMKANDAPAEQFQRLGLN